MKPRIVVPAAPVLLAAIAFALALALSSVTPAEATIFKFEANLDEAQAIGTCNPNPAPAGGGGQAVVVYNDVTNELSWSVTYQNLSGAVILAHFHRTSDAKIQVDMAADLTSPMQGTATLSNSTNPPVTKSQLESELLAGQWYINIHTSACTGGEIRGQVVAAAVGGIAELPGVDDTTPLAQPDSSDSNAGVMAGIATGAAALVVALGGAVVYARRRWLR